MAGIKGDPESFAALFEQSASGALMQRRFRVGERVEVGIVALGREAVFADLGGKQEGYFDRVELCDAEGRLTVAVGGRVSAVVGRIDEATGQVRLSPVFVRRAAEPEPVEPDLAGLSIPIARSGPLLVEGARVHGKVTGVERYGIFVQVDGTHGRAGRGLVPTSETATPRGADLKKHFVVGQEVAAKILSIDESGRIRLSIAAARADDERGEFEAYLSGGSPEPAEQAAAAGDRPAVGAKKPKPEPRKFGTLGDLLAKHKRQ